MRPRLQLPFSVAFELMLASGCGGPAKSTAPTPPVLDTPCQAGMAAGPLLPIINGTPCDAANSAVVMLRMRYDEGGSSALCSGTVVAPRLVLTAAHCLVTPPLDITIARVGASDIVSRAYVVHSGYRRSEQYPLDVALIKTDQDLTRRAIAVLISRPARIGEGAVLTGFGRDQTGTSGTLRAGTATVDFVGVTYFTTRNTEANGMLCSGDSGGPILLSQNGEWALAGVAYETIYTGANTPICESGISVYASMNNAAISSFLRTEAAAATFR